ncbi:MAG TPA: hydroxysqualene dehydroxylase HpnE [Caulobacteraceae bacterium]
MQDSPTTYVIGAGLAGLSAATALAARGQTVELIEAAAQAGGRCRSYVDPTLQITIDNGNHLVLSGNHATMAYLARIGASHRLAGPDEAVFQFCDVRDGTRWTIRPNPGPLAWWVLAKDRRVPGASAADYLALAALLGPQGDKRIDQVIRCEGPLWERLLEPFLLAALNTKPQEGSAALAAAVIRETLALGGRRYKPRIASPTLAAAFVEPALAWLTARGATVSLGQRLRNFDIQDGRVAALALADRQIVLAPTDTVILAVPPWIAQSLLPDLTVPDRFQSIVNAHFLIAPPTGAAPILGVIGGTAEWIFAFEDRLSVTVSGADAIVDLDRETLAARLWADVAKAHGLDAAPLPPWQIVKEKRATFEATPAQNARRPGARTAFSNLILAGDWTDTGLPATIEGAVRSGHKAAAMVGR